MNVNVLIDSIVAQTTVLIAQLATAAGTRAPLAHTANQVFLDLVRELKGQGLGNKVIADMFGLALRTYHNKVRRLSESSTFRGRSLWGAVLEYVQERETVLRAEVLRRFSADDAAVVRSVLTDLVDAGLLFRSGRGDRTAYRAVTDIDPTGEDDAEDRLRNLVWIAIHRFGPVDAKELAKVVPLEGPQLESVLSRLVAEGRAARVIVGETARYRCDECVIPLGDSSGWEAAVWDHYQAMVTAICAKVARGETHAEADDRIGGSTYSFEVWDGHPHFDEVAGFLRDVRRPAVALREKVDAYNREHPVPGVHSRFIAYVGQTLIDVDNEGAAE